ncbi:MAG: efflux RND transporter periplasmic adaptor subunit, partial [Planctomycetes bacterium]|nr:efflux RND transporter periplasmic adaptor subunit [Planctomycetota bacterium]
DAPLPVRVERPSRGTVSDAVETQAALETDRHVTVYAEADGKVVEKARDLGDRVGGGKGGDDAMLLARIDDRELKLALEEAEVDVRNAEGRIRELELGKKLADREVEQAEVSLREAEGIFARAAEGMKDGTISLEEHERATFARNLAGKKVESAQAAVEKGKVALELGSVAVERARAVRDRAAVLLERATIRSPIAGVVTLCNVREGERVRAGEVLYKVEEPDTLVLYGNLPVRDAARVEKGDAVTVESSAVEGRTGGKVVLVAPTVDRDSGTVRVKAEIEPAPGFRPGLFVTMRIVIATREGALVVPRRALLHDDEEGPYVFVVREGKATRVPVRTGFEGEGVLEVEGIGEEDMVLVEGQDTVSDGAAVEILADPGSSAAAPSVAKAEAPPAPEAPPARGE